MAEPGPPQPAAALVEGAAIEGEPTGPTEGELKDIEDERIRAEEERIRIESERIRFEREEKKRIEEEERKAEEERQSIEQVHLQMLIDATHDEIHRLKSENVELQRRMCTMQKKRRNENAGQFLLEGQDAYYRARLRYWTEAKVEFQRVKDELDRKIDNLRASLQEKQNESAARHEGMIHYFWSTARHSRDIVSAQRIPRRTLLELEHEERDSIAEMQAVRIRGRQLKSQLAKLELKLELKDQLQLDTGNLHVVDYEQLKMENESLNAKIHLKNEALSGLKKKTAQLVHCLTHVREKMQFLAVACKVDGEALANDDHTLHSSRIKTSRLKTSIMNIKRKKDALQKNFVGVSSPVILDDMDYQREDIEVAQNQFEALKKRYLDLCADIEQKKKMLFASGALPAPGQKSGAQHMYAIECGNQRWGSKREILGQMVVKDLVRMIAGNRQRNSSSACID